MWGNVTFFKMPDAIKISQNKQTRDEAGEGILEKDKALLK